MRRNLTQFDGKSYRATAQVNTDQAQKNVRGLGDTIGNYFTRVSQRSFRTALVRMATFRTAAVSAISAVVPAAASATAAVGGLASVLSTAALGAAAFGAVAAPQISAVTDAIEDGKVQMSELSAELQPLGRAVQTVLDAFEALKSATRGAVTDALISGTEALAALLPTLEPLINATAAAFERMGDSLTASFQSQGFRDFVSFLSENVGPVMDQLFRIVTNLARGIGGLMQAFMPMGQGLLESIADGMERFATWANNLGQNEGFQEFLDYANRALPVMGDLIKAAGGAIANLAKSLANIGLQVAKGLTNILESIANMDPTLLAAIATGLSAVVAAIGVGLGPGAIAAAGGVAALVGAFSTLEGGVSSLSKPLQRIVQFFQDVWNRIVEVSKAIWNEVEPAFTALWDKVQNEVIPAFANFLDAAKPVVMWFIDFLKPIVTSVMKSVAGFIDGALDTVIGIFKVFTGILTGNWSKAWNGIKQLLSGVVKGIWNFLKLWFVGKLVKLLRGGLRLISNLFTKVWNGIRGFVMKIWNAIVSWFGKKLTQFKKFWSDTWNGILGTIKGIWNNIWSTIRGVWNSITSWFSSAFNTYMTRWRQGWQTIVDQFKKIWGGIVDIAKGVWNNVKDAFKTGINAVTGFINKWFISPINKVLGKFGLEIPSIPQLAAGGKMTQEVEFLAKGGSIGSGFKTNRPTAIVGEGKSNAPEYVIPTDPKHRNRARQLHAEAGEQLMASGGVVGSHRQPRMMEDGGILDFITDLPSKAWEGIKNVGEGVKWLGQESWDLIQKGAGWIMDNTIKPIVDKVKSVLPENTLGDTARGTIDMAYRGIRDFFRDKEEEVNQASKKAQESGQVANARPADQWAPVVQRALSMLDMPQSWLGATLRQIQIESGGNPNAQNNWDINAQMGVPSQGLLQTIPPTFNANKLPGFGNIQAPLDNVLAALRYTVDRYGSVPNIWPTRGGYDNGGALQPGWNLAYNGTGKPENVRSGEAEDALLRKLDEIAALLSEREGMTFNIGQASPDTADEFADKVLTRLRHRRKEPTP